MLSSNEIEDWLTGYYQYSIRLTDVTGKQEFLYTDINRSTIGSFELIETMSASLVPSTEILAEQHYRKLQTWLSPLGVEPVWLTGSLKAKEKAAAQARIANGEGRLIVGTHALIADGVEFQQLGLVVVDEQHRFGVRQRLQLQKKIDDIDVECHQLMMSATPIPRTLAMSYYADLEISVIDELPPGRKPVTTKLVKSSRRQEVLEGLKQELNKGTQVYWVCPLIEESEALQLQTAQATYEYLKNGLPGFQVGLIHGRLKTDEKNAVMSCFLANEIGVLVATTVIEVGVDVPNASLMVIEHAERFGLSQLHQLRGRVGRSHHQAYAYLMVPDTEGLTKQAQQRLEAIQQMEELGSGFYLAMHDLEIRGAGEVLGENQSGDMMEVGFQLYNEMLAEAVRALKSGQEPDLMSPMQAATEINLHAPALLPDDYCGDVHLRLSFYKKLAMANTMAQVDQLLEEIVDRFGKPPTATQTLIDVHRLRVLAKPFGVAKVDAAPGVTNIAFRPHAPVDGARIIEMVQKNRHIKLAGNDKLRIERPIPDARDRAQAIRDVLRYLVGCATLPPDVNRWFDIGGPDVLRYGQMMNGYAVVAGLPQRAIAALPVLTPRLASLWVNLVPFFAVLWAMAYGFWPNIYQIAGGLVALSGVVYMQWRKLKATPPRPA